MDRIILDTMFVAGKSQNTNLESFTEPLRAVLGGRRISYRDEHDTNPKITPMLSLRVRVIRVAILLTIALPYTVAAACCLGVSAFNQKVRPAAVFGFSQLDEEILSKVLFFKDSKIMLSNNNASNYWDTSRIETKTKPVQEKSMQKFAREIPFTTWTKVARGEAITHALCIPIVRVDVNETQKRTRTALILEKDPNDPHAQWSCSLDSCTFALNSAGESSENVLAVKNLLSGGNAEANRCVQFNGACYFLAPQPLVCKG